MKLAIVGTSNVKPSMVISMRNKIEEILQNYWNNETIIISGGAKGVDTIVKDVAKHMGFIVKEYLPKAETWEYYKERNQKIANECDALFCFTTQTHTMKCYHHDNLQDHEKTAGCWTGLKVIELGKPCDIIVIPSRNTLHSECSGNKS